MFLKKNGKLTFCHDADGLNYKSRKDYLARVTYEDYAGPSHFQQGPKFTVSGKGHFEHTIICVYFIDKWYVINCGIKQHAISKKIEIFHRPLFSIHQDVIVTFYPDD